MRDTRNDSAFDALLNKAMKRIVELELDYTKLPPGMACRPPARLTGQAVSYAATTVSNLFGQYFRLLDVAIRELKEWFIDKAAITFKTHVVAAYLGENVTIVPSYLIVWKLYVVHNYHVNLTSG